MEIVHRCCCGLDVHKKMIVACLIVLDAAGQRVLPLMMVDNSVFFPKRLTPSSTQLILPSI